VDSKAVMDACVEAQQSEDDAHRTVLLKKHCDNVRSRVADLASKNYFADHRDAVEAVVLFLPAENLYATAVENDPGLTEYAMTRNIIVCGPNSLMMLLKVANQLWQRASIEEEALKIKECGDSIYKSACDFVEKFAKIGSKIRQLEGDYNDAAGTLDGRLIPRGREMSRFTSVSNHRELEDVPLLKEDIREFRSSEAKKLLAITAEKLPGLALAELETAELTFASGEK
jgi:DNA recombination protein RmuC